MKKLEEGKEIQIRRKVIEDDRRESRAIEKGLWLVIVNEDEGWSESICSEFDG